MILILLEIIVYKSCTCLKISIHLKKKTFNYFGAVLGSQQNGEEGRVPIYALPHHMHSPPVSTPVMHLLQSVNLHWHSIIIQSP